MKALKMLQGLKAEERKRFRQYLECPLLGNSKMLTRLLGAMVGEGEIPPGEEELFGRLYPNKPFNQSHLRRNLTLMVKALEDFLALETYMQNPRQQAINRLRSLNREGFEKFFERKYHHLTNGEGEAVPDFGLLLKVEEERDFCLGRQGVRPGGLRFQRRMELLNRELLIKKMELACLAFNHDLIKGTQHQATQFQELLEWGEFLGESAPLLFRMYRAVYASLQDEESGYRELRQLLSQNAQELESYLQRELYGYARNFCMRRYNRKDKSFQRELWELHEEMEQRGLLFEKGMLSGRDLKNYVVMYLSTGSLEGAMGFFKRNRERVPLDDGGTAVLHTEAVLCFHQKDFIQSRILLNRAMLTQGEGLDPLFGLDIFAYLLRVHFELGQGDEVERLSRNFRRRLSRDKKIAKANRLRYGNFSQLIKELASIKEGSPQKRRNKMLKWWENFGKKKGMIVFLQWLKEMANELDEA